MVLVHDKMIRLGAKIVCLPSVQYSWMKLEEKESFVTCWLQRVAFILLWYCCKILIRHRQEREMCRVDNSWAVIYFQQPGCHPPQTWDTGQPGWVFMKSHKHKTSMKIRALIKRWQRSFLPAPFSYAADIKRSGCSKCWTCMIEKNVVKTPPILKLWSPLCRWQLVSRFDFFKASSAFFWRFPWLIGFNDYCNHISLPAVCWANIPDSHYN